MGLPTMRGLQGKNVLVTGASSGIGRAIAIRFASEGCNIGVNYVSSREKAEETKTQMQELCGIVEACGSRNVLLQADVSNEADVKRMFDEMVASLGSVDILINNAGIMKHAPSHQMSVETFETVLSTNLTGAFLCAREALQHFLDRNYAGAIINVSSVHEIIPKPEFAGYSASKGGLLNLTRTLALEYARHQIRVNAIAPGATLTPMNDWANDPQKRRKVEKHIPMERAGKPEEMAAAVAFLASSEAAYITGQTLYIDGGLTLYPAFEDNWSS